MSGTGGHQGVQIHGRYWPTEKTTELLREARMNTKERIIAKTRDGIRSWTALEMARELEVSYSTARCILIALWRDGQLHRYPVTRLTANGKRAEFVYYRTKLKGF